MLLRVERRKAGSELVMRGTMFLSVRIDSPNRTVARRLEMTFNMGASLREESEVTVRAG